MRKAVDFFCPELRIYLYIKPYRSTTLIHFPKHHLPLGTLPNPSCYSNLISLYLCIFGYTVLIIRGIIIIIYSSLLSLCSRLGYERPTPYLFLTDTDFHSDTQAEPRKLSSLTLYIDLWQVGKPAPGQNPPVIYPPVVIGVRAEIRTQNSTQG
jgi:hypothetical protein